MKLDDRRFLEVIDAAPLVSIDLVVRNDSGEVLLGKRMHRPAQGCWFVPGGRIRKGERLEEAMRRISEAEVGFALSRKQTRFLGVYEHHYDDNFFGQDGISTHYVVLAHEVRLEPSAQVRTDSQHSELKWWPVEELLRHAGVHDNSKAYFR